MSYKGKYIKHYFWSGVSMLLSFVSMFIVAPLATSMPEAYGIYSLCISFDIFLRYADLGFIAAGRKYAAEAFSVSNIALEKKYVGTSISFYGLMCLALFIIALVLSIYPEFVIKDIDKGPYYGMAQQLFLIFAFSIPFSIVQKFCNLIYTVRIEAYKTQRIQIVGSIIKIASVPLYFFNNKYDLVGYYLFCVFLNLLIGLYLLYYSKRIGYGLKVFCRCLILDKLIFQKMKPLALGGFVSVIGWISYYELDTIGVSLLLGANAVAIYAIGIQIQTFVRTLIGILFSPYPVRINYFIGQKDIEGLKRFVFELAEAFSFIVIPIMSIVLFAKPFVLSWVGNNYEESILILQLLVLTFIIHYITSPGGAVLFGLNKVKDIMRLSFIQPFVFWIGVFVTYKYWGIASFAIFKLIASISIGLYYVYLTKKYLKYTRSEFYRHLLAKPLMTISFTCLMIWYLLSPFVDNVTKGMHDLIFVVSVMAICCLLAFAVDLWLNKSLRNQMRAVMDLIMNRYKA